MNAGELLTWKNTRRGVGAGERIWELRPNRLAETRRYLDQIAAQWDAALGRLREFVEK